MSLSGKTRNKKPAGLKRAISGFRSRQTGRIDGVYIRNLSKYLLFRAAVFIVALHIAFIIATSALIFAYKFVNPSVTGIKMYRSLLYTWKFKTTRYLPIEKIPKRTRNMIIRVEDGDFYTHHGILPSALKNAWQINRQIGHTVYGGSTITMQTARTLFLVPDKNYLRKYLEMIIALEMEAILDKDRIFELYLNNAEWGKGVFGIEAASWHHYGKGVRNLSNDEAIRLVTLLSSPILYTPANLTRSGILRARYNYLTERYN